MDQSQELMEMVLEDMHISMVMRETCATSDQVDLQQVSRRLQL